MKIILKEESIRKRLETIQWLLENRSFMHEKSNMKEYNYINTPTRLLIEAIGTYISEKDELFQHPRVVQAFQALQEISEKVPSFVRYVEESINRNHSGFSQKELTLMELYLMLRVLSTYTTIPVLVGHLQLCGEYEAAALINSNAIDEGGGKGNPSHHALMVNSLNIVARQLGSLPVTSKHLVAAIRIYELIPRTTGAKISDHEALWALLQSDAQYIPIQKTELHLAVEIAEMLDENMLQYHRHIQETLLTPTRSRIISKQTLAMAALELAKREAESVDEKENNLSFIGAWEKLIQYYESHIPPNEYERTIAWSAAHNGEEQAKNAGWYDRTAEDGHARDARTVALHFLKTLNAAEFAETLEQITKNAALRLEHWDHLVDSLNQIRSTTDYYQVLKA